MIHLKYNDFDFELNNEQVKIIQSGYFNSENGTSIIINDSYDNDIISMFLDIINDKTKLDISNHKNEVYWLFMLAKSWGISEYQTFFGKFIFGPDFEAEPLQRIEKLNQFPIKDRVQCSINSKIYQAIIGFSSVHEEKNIIDILDDKNEWFYQSDLSDSCPFLIIYFIDGEHVIKNYTIVMSRLHSCSCRLRKWKVEGYREDKWILIDSGYQTNDPGPGKPINRSITVKRKFSAIKIISNEKKKMGFSSVLLECDPPLSRR